MTVKEITLLSKEEYEKYKSVIPKIAHWWWLRSSGNYQYTTSIVGTGGIVDYSGIFIRSALIAVRPALRLNLEFSDSLFWYKPKKLIGTKIEYGECNWTILDTEFSELYILCDDIIAERRFDPESNDWDKSELKRWLETEGLKCITD